MSVAPPAPQSAAAARTVELSGEFTPPIVGLIQSQFLPGNGRVVYQVWNGQFAHSWSSAPLVGSSPPVELAHHAGSGIDFSADGSRAVFYDGCIRTVPTDGSVESLAVDCFAIEDMNNYQPRISPDGQWVVYQLNEGPLELRSARADGSSGPHVLYPAHVGYVISPDSARVFFPRTELYMTPIDGSASALSLSGTPVAGGSVRELFVSPDGARVVYAGDTESVGLVELFSVPSDGSAGPVKLSAGGEVSLEYSYLGGKPAITPDGKLVVYRVDRELDGNIELCSVPIDGSASPIEISGAMASNREVSLFAPTPDGRRVLYLADRDVNDRFELFVTNVHGRGQPVKVSGPVAGDVHGFAVTADSSYAVYRADQAQVGQLELFSVAIGRFRRGDAPRVVKLSLPLDPGTSVRDDFQIFGQRVVYTVALPGNRYESFSVPIQGGAAASLTPDFGPDGFASPVQVSPEGIGVFVGSQGPSFGQRLFSEPLDASSPPQDISGPLAFGATGEVESLLLTPDGDHAIYVAGEDDPDMLELHYVPTDGAVPAVKISGQMPLPELGSTGVVQAQLFANGTRVAYLARQEGDTVASLYEGPADGSVPPQKLTGSEGEALLGFVLTTDGEHFVYRVALTPSTQALYSVRVDGSLAPARLNMAGGGNQVHVFAVSSDGARVAYRSDELSSGKAELFAVPTDASAPRVRLHGNVASTRDVDLFAIDPTGARVAFSADHATDNAFDLWSAPADASAAPVRLNPALPAGREVRAVRFSPDGQRVVYSADQDADQLVELFSAPSDGSGSAIELNVPLVPGRAVGSFEVGPAGTRVVYVADQDADNVTELYSVPIDGSAAPVKLNAPLAPGADVLGFSVAGGRVLYRQGIGPFQVELHCVPLDGSASAWHLSPGVATGAVELYALDRSGTRVAFTTRNVALPFTLFTVPADGMHDPYALGSFSSTEELAFTADATRVVHRSTRPGEFELRLFSTRMPHWRLDSR